MYADPGCRGVLTALKTLARRHEQLTDEINALDGTLCELVREFAPHLLQLHGAGVTTAAQLLITAGGNPERLHSEASFAALCGTAPVPASSARPPSPPLQGRDRRANNALHTVALVRMRCHPQARAFVERQRDRGRSSPEILRLLKRQSPRKCTNISRPQPALGIDDLRPARQAKNITLQAAADALGIQIMTLSRTERGLYLNADLTIRYREWLKAA